MATAAEYGHNSWELSIQVDQREGDEGMKFKLRVKGDLHVGGLMLKLVEKISESFTEFCVEEPVQIVNIKISSLSLNECEFELKQGMLNC